MKENLLFLVFALSSGFSRSFLPHGLSQGGRYTSYFPPDKQLSRDVMSPLQDGGLSQRAIAGSEPPTQRNAIVLEGWSEGFRLVQYLFIE